MTKFIQLAWRNMWRNWRRTLIASIAIVLSLILLIFMSALITGSDQAIFGNAVRLYGGNIQVHAPGFRLRSRRLPLIPMNNSDQIVARANQIPEVVAVNKRINTSGLVSTRAGNLPVAITAIEPDGEAPISLIAENMIMGRFLTTADRDGILVGQELAELLEIEVGDRVTLLGRRKSDAMRQHSMTVIGIYELGMDAVEKGTVYINLADAQILYNLRDSQTEITISLEEVGQEETIIPILQNDLPDVEVDSWKTLRPEIEEVIQSKQAITSIFGFIVVIIASIGILNLMMMAVFERTREMGILAALGMKGRQIVLLFLLEGTMIGLFGAVIGCFLGWLLILWIAQIGGIDYSFASEMGGELTALMGNRLIPAISFSDIAGHGLMVVVVAALASLYPAWQAIRHEPAEALHHV